jgi:NADH dehydrogenase (ubiquinone) 1 alpha subcomplex subunit 5
MLCTRIVRAASSAQTIKSAAAGASKLLRGKQTTELTGLAVHPRPFAALDETYNKTLKLLETLPSESVYRQAAHALTTSRLDALRETQKRHANTLNNPGADAVVVEEAVQDFENAVDQGQIEEVIIQAQDELYLTGKMLEWKS